MASSIKPYARALYEAAEGKSKADITGMVDKILSALKDKRLLSRIPELITEVERLDDEANHRLRAELTSAHRLDETTVAKFEQLLKKRTGAKEIVWEKQVDHALFGGAVIRYGDTVLDMSLAKSVERLADTIKK